VGSPLFFDRFHLSFFVFCFALGPNQGSFSLRKRIRRNKGQTSGQTQTNPNFTFSDGLCVGCLYSFDCVLIFFVFFPSCLERKIMMMMINIRFSLYQCCRHLERKNHDNNKDKYSIPPSLSRLILCHDYQLNRSMMTRTQMIDSSRFQAISTTINPS
jgi:hypothetical protein